MAAREVLISGRGRLRKANQLRWSGYVPVLGASSMNAATVSAPSGLPEAPEPLLAGDDL